MKNKNRFFVLLVLCAVLMTASVAYAEPDVIAVTVTAQDISIAVANGASVAYGVMPLDTTKSTVQIGGSQITVTNDGNVNEDFDIKSSDSTDWTLSGTANGDEIFTHEFSSDATNWTLMTTDYATLAANQAPAATATNLDLRIETPTSTVAYTEQEISVTIQATIAN